MRKSPTFKEMIICVDCGKEEQKTGPKQIYCKECKKRRITETKRKWYANNFENAYKESEKKYCSVCGSENKVCKFKGVLYCSKHYNQMYRMGETYSEKKKRRENKYIVKGDYTEVWTVKNECILIDTKDLELIKPYYWSLNSQGYAITVLNRKHKRLHILLTNRPNDMVVDHINGNKLDNRRNNLRLCTNKENSFNVSVAKNNKTGYLGISKTKFGKYKARIMADGLEIRLGNFEKLEDAIKAREEAEKKYFGEYAPSLSRK